MIPEAQDMNSGQWTIDGRGLTLLSNVSTYIGLSGGNSRFCTVTSLISVQPRVM